ncbi:zymogen granule membrane protein 16-like [Chanos chanos]|uniref:Zymogen granule membrane protein 16-like n=1 Tax=Chanos chanos TaxID=29144 RepID=A0A6J2W6U6_CHACN|nr:zymogen granule membrane protein 16-like [Chanos chanos]
MPLGDSYSYSPTVGGGSGATYVTSGEGRITGVRIWELSGNYIRGFQLRYEYGWTPVIGTNSGDESEMTLFDDEAIIQISGKYTSSYIYSLVFVTSRGRSFQVGQPTGSSFNFYPTHDGAELRLLSGRQNGQGITSIGAHWGAFYSNSTH